MEDKKKFEIELDKNDMMRFILKKVKEEKEKREKDKE